MITSIKSALNHTVPHMRAPKISIHPFKGSEKWTKEVTPIVRDFFKSKDVCEVFTASLTLNKERALKNLAILENNGCFSRKTLSMKDSDGNYRETPFYGEVLLNDTKLTATLVDKVSLYKKKSNLQLEEIVKLIINSRLNRNSPKLFSDERTLPIEWPEEMLVNLDSKKEPKFTIISNTAIALDIHEMLDYMNIMSEEQIITYAKTVVKFTIATNCLQPTLKTLPICRGNTDSVIVRNFNHLIESLYIPDNEAQRCWPAVGLLHAIEIGEKQKLRDPYLETLYKSYKGL